MMKRSVMLVLACCVLSCAHPRHDSVPGHLDPYHHIRFQNGYVRVMETYLEPGEETWAHSHPIESAIIFLTDGTFRITSDDGSMREVFAQRHTVAFGDSAIVHRTRNYGDAPARVVAVEVFSRPPATSDEAVDFDLGEMLLDNDKVRITRVRLEPGVSTGLCGASSSVLVALTPGVLRSRGGGRATTLGVGDVLWSEPGDEAVRVSGTRTIDAILVLLKPRLQPG